MRSKLLTILMCVMFLFAVTGVTPAFAAKGAKKITTTQSTGKKHKHKHGKGKGKHKAGRHHMKHKEGNKGGKKTKTTAGANV